MKSEGSEIPVRRPRRDLTRPVLLGGAAVATVMTCTVMLYRDVMDSKSDDVFGHRQAPGDVLRITVGGDGYFSCPNIGRQSLDLLESFLATQRREGEALYAIVTGTAEATVADLARVHEAASRAGVKVAVTTAP